MSVTLPLLPPVYYVHLAKEWENYQELADSHFTASTARSIHTPLSLLHTNASCTCLHSGNLLCGSSERCGFPVPETKL